MHPIDQLVDVLEFKREVMTQLPTVSTLLAVMAMTVVAALISVPERGRLRSSLMVALTTAAMLFVFATILDACIVPGMKRQATMRNAEQIKGLLRLGDVVVWTILIGIGVLFGSLGGIGFLHSKRTGVAILTTTGVIVAAFVACCFYLDRVMTM